MYRYLIVTDSSAILNQINTADINDLIDGVIKSALKELFVSRVHA